MSGMGAEAAGDDMADGDSRLDFFIGHDKRGSWFVVEAHGLAGGFFRSELDAFKFVLADFRRHPKRIEVLGDSVQPFDGTCVEVANRCRNSVARPIVALPSDDRRVKAAR